MDATKTISYRRWRKRLLEKGLLNAEIARDESFKVPVAVKTAPAEEDFLLELGEMKLKMLSFNKRSDSSKAKELIKELEREYHKNEVFRKEKVAELKKMIKNGDYQVSGKEVVDKWFPEDSASESLE